MMKQGYSETFLKMIIDRNKKIISIDEIKSIAQKAIGENYEEKKTYKLIHLAKSKDILLSLNKNEFYINKNGGSIKEDDIIEEFYIPLLLQNCKKLCGSNNRYIGGIKGIELYNNMSDYPDIINIFTNNKSISSHTIVLGKKIIFKNLQMSGKDDRRKIVKKHINFDTSWGGKKVQIGSIELCMLEALYSIPYDQKNYTNELIKKTLKKIKKNYNLSIIEILTKGGKFHSPLNRLLELAEQVNVDLYQDLNKIMKKHSYNLSSRI